MKKLLSLLMAVLLTLAIPMACAEESFDDNPFKPGIDYSIKYTDYGAKPSMLNFGSIPMSQISHIYENSVKKTTITKTSVTEIEENLINESLFYYIYAKYQTAKSVPDHTITTMLVMTDPLGKHYSDTSTRSVSASGSNYRYSGLAFFFDATTPLIRCYLENNGLPKGEYTFAMYFDNKTFRVNTITLY